MAFGEEKDYPLYLALCKHCYHSFASKVKGAQHCHRCTEIMALKAENSLQAQQIIHLTEEVTRLKKALRIADEAVNIATDSGVY